VLKLMKYEFRRNRTGLLVMLIIALALFALAPLGQLLNRQGMVLASVALLAFYCVAAYIFVLLRGVTAYSSELKGRTGYLLLMIPRSTYAILFSKLLFALFFALVMTAIAALLFFAALGVMMSEVYEVRNIVDLFRFMLRSAGLNPTEMLNVLGAGIAVLLCSVFTAVSAGYLAVTLGATLLQGSRMRGFVSFVLYVALLSLIAHLAGLASPALADAETLGTALLADLPVMALNLLLGACCTVLSALLLKRKVCL